ncbi:MAG: hypothetical protein INQ03_19110 [Candidatus Heimdallarchaeota archaeon]|nr:hypothetical protein [Candidatus Heimdallarchaeota archaeon]
MHTQNTQDIPVAESYKGIYAMHKYWSKKPYNVIRGLIEEYTEQDEIVLDPFSGSGVSITEALFSGRKAVGIDINPAAIFITDQTLKKIPIKLIINEFESIKNDLLDTIQSMYEVKREKSYIGTHFIWEKKSLTEVWYKQGNKSVKSSSTTSDQEQANQFTREKINYFYPKLCLIENSRINANKRMQVADLFTNRNLTALSMLLHRINSIENSELRNLFRFIFTATLGQASNMVFVVKKRGKMAGKSDQKKSVGSWVIGYWIPKEHFEINVWNCFQNRYKKVLKAKTLQYDMKYDVDYAHNFDHLKNHNLLLVNYPSQLYLSKFADNSIDYVITDPPHGNRLPYLELSLLWNSWLEFETVDYENEIVISEAKSRGKNVEEYTLTLNLVIREIARVLKLNRRFTLLFNSLDDDVWFNLITSIYALPFELDNIQSMHYSAGSVVQDSRKRGLKTDFIITFIKSGNDTPRQISRIYLEQVDMLEEILEYRSTHPPFYDFMNFIIKNTLQNNSFPYISEIIRFYELKNQVTND